MCVCVLGAPSCCQPVQGWPCVSPRLSPRLCWVAQRLGPCLRLSGPLAGAAPSSHAHSASIGAAPGIFSAWTGLLHGTLARRVASLQCSPRRAGWICRVCCALPAGACVLCAIAQPRSSQGPPVQLICTFDWASSVVVEVGLPHRGLLAIRPRARGGHCHAPGCHCCTHTPGVSLGSGFGLGIIPASQCQCSGAAHPCCACACDSTQPGWRRVVGVAKASLAIHHHVLSACTTRLPV